MPEGDAIRRLAETFDEVFVGHRVHVSSPQGRFASSAARLDGWTLARARAVGKHMFLGFVPPPGETSGEVDHWVHIHLGLYGWWRFNGDSTVMDLGHGVARRVGPKDTHRPQRWGTGPLNPAPEHLTELRDEGGGDLVDGPGAGAPESADVDDLWEAPEPIGQVRLRILADHAVADLAGPTRCELIGDAERVAAEAKLGPDPLAPGAREDRAAAGRFVDAVRYRRRAIGELVMDQSIIAGVGNIYRAEALFLAGISPMRKGERLSAARARKLWVLICDLMNRGLAAGYLVTMDPDEAPDPPIEGDEEASRWYVYHRTGRPCLRCGTPIAEKPMQARRLFWCPSCQS
ncbi:Fpg/Nei family DNA glycosylase [Schaalia sp. 19OD2882]|uniref:Fpg/Nei family DNA glycosylase n=1 Tax=Schaalia sp. 19OD2882 TaxID=2794089 RepID=UPI001C1EE13F|nr:DNA-formamidopyrimidine glycosylase family protein [Schaalia sp. 19OD2882]QWW20387.1 Fpg/Nei family DNA glycosylase [Schaalia sp. 19OD2882]